MGNWKTAMNLGILPIFFWLDLMGQVTYEIPSYFRVAFVYQGFDPQPPRISCASASWCEQLWESWEPQPTTLVLKDGNRKTPKPLRNTLR